MKTLFLKDNRAHQGFIYLNNKYLHYHLTNLWHPCWIKVLIFKKIKSFYIIFFIGSDMILCTLLLAAMVLFMWWYAYQSVCLVAVAKQLESCNCLFWRKRFAEHYWPPTHTDSATFGCSLSFISLYLGLSLSRPFSENPSLLLYPARARL